MARCLIGCGSNRGSRRDQLDRAVELLRYMPGVTMQAVSRYRETAPVGGPPGQRAFLNGACLIETDLKPHDVLQLLTAVENTLHRERVERWADRTIDLDLLLYDDLIVDSEDLTVPHPRMATRRFVLEPAAEIAAELHHPIAACTVKELLDNIATHAPLIAIVGVPGTATSEIMDVVADSLMAHAVHANVPHPGDDLSASRCLATWRHAVTTWSEAVATDCREEGPHITVTNAWCETLLGAAAEVLTPDDQASLHAHADSLRHSLMRPTAALFLHADEATLRERVAFHLRQASQHTDVFADLAATTILLPALDDAVASLLRMQERIEQWLRGGSSRCLPPRAVVRIDAGDLPQAIAEASAAVEAML